MALTFSQQYDVASNALVRGDVDLLAKLIQAPDSVSIKEQRTVAEKLGLKNGFLRAAVNTAADPMVWLATLMSRKFPTQAWLKGTIPQRFIGTMNEFSGVSLALKPADSMFRGTNIPKLISLSQHRHAHVMEVAQKRIFDVINRPNWTQEMPIVSLALEGGNPAGLTPELKRVTQAVRSGMNEMWGFLARTQRIEGGLDKGEFSRARPFTAQEAPKFLRDYLPHIPLTGHESTIELNAGEALSRLGGERNRSVAQMLAGQGENVQDVWKLGSQGQLQSSFARFQQWAQNVGPQVYNPHMFRRVRHGLQLEGPKGQELFHTDLNLVLQKYASAAARTYSLNAPLTPAERAMTSSFVESPLGVVSERITPSADPIMVQIINEGLRTVGVQRVSRQIAGVENFIDQFRLGSGSLPLMKSLEHITRSVKGTQSEDDILFGSLYNRVFNKLDAIKGRMKPDELNQITAGVDAIARGKDHRRKLDSLTNYFYVSTLGLNPLSAIKNMMQPIVTTAPALGVGPTLAGIKEFAPKVRRFAGDIAQQLRTMPSGSKGFGRVADVADRTFSKHFPELVGQKLSLQDLDPRLYDVDEATVRRLAPSGKFIDKESFFKFLMAPFTSTEVSNRAVSFYAARSKMRHLIRTGEMDVPIRPDTGQKLDGADFDAWMNLEAGNVVNATQFRPGPGSRTYVQALLPGPLRQFSSFPLRMLNFMAESTVRGAMTQAQLQQSRNLKTLMGDPITGASAFLGGRNLGTISRMFLYSQIAKNGLRDVLGVDISGAVGVALPFQGAPENQAFSPLPIPPLPSMVFGAVDALANRDVKRLQPLELPGGIQIPVPKTMFPGGVGLGRAFRAWNQFRPDLGGFVDDNQRLKIKGDTLDLTIAMLGVPMNKSRRERHMMERLHANRGAQRQITREFKLAATNFDFRQMDQIRAKYKQRFPDMPALAISNNDLVKFDSQRRITRVQRMLQTMPAAFKTMEDDIYDIDSDLIARPPQNPLAGLLGAG